MVEIDSLEIKISSSVQKANDAIDGLIRNLGRLTAALKIDTSGLEKIGKSLNVEGFKKSAKSMKSQAQKVSKSISQIMEQYKDLGKGFSFSGSMPALKKQIDSYSNALEKAKLKMQELESSESTGGKGYENAIKDVIKYENILESLNKQFAEMRAVKPQLNIDISGIEEAGKKVSEVTEQIRTVSIPESAFNYNADAMKAVFGEMTAGIENWSQATQRFGANAGAVLNQTSSKTEELKARTEQFEQSLKSLQIPPVNTDNINVLQKELAKSESEFEKLKVKLANGIAMGRISANVDDKGFRTLREQMALSEKTAEALREKIKQVQQVSNQTSTGAKKLGDSIKSASSSILGLTSSSAKAIKPLNNLGNSFKSLLRTILPILGIRQLFNWGRQAIEVSSDLTEVQNVVDTTFGDMAYKVEEFAETSIEKFGMSELALKQISGRFQAMGTAMGFPIDKMSDMSIELTGLAADMASFYNVSQEDVAKSLESIFTGTTRPLRQYGLDLTQATLQEWALNNGINANIQSMSQAEKTLLRYQYVMANTGAAQGDFARTANTWANQVRILKMNFQQLASIIGGVLVNAFKPVVKAINAAMSHIIAFAKTISNALGKIFGWTYEEGAGSGITQDFDDAADAADGMAAGTEETLDNLKKMQRYIAPWHEVNNMTTDLGDSGNGSGGGTGGTGGGAGGGAVGGGWVKGESILKQFESEIDSLYELGKYISDTLSNVMESINWDKVYEKARNFGTGLANFLNGLINPRLFGNIGKTIAGSLNTALHFLDSFGTTFDWKNFGNSLASGINNFFSTFDFALLADTVNVWTKGILDSIIEALEDTDWEMIGRQIGTFLAELDFIEIGKKIGIAIWDAINAGIDLFKGMFSVAPVETAILSILALPALVNFGSKIIGFVATPIVKLWNIISPIITPMASAVSEMFALWSSGAGTLSEAFAAVTGVSLPLVAAIAAIVAAIIDLWNTSDVFKNSVIDAFKKIKNSLVDAFEKVKKAIQPLWESIKELGKSLYDFYESSPIKPIVELFATLAATIAGSAISIAIDAISAAFSGLAQILTGAFEILSGVLDILTGIFELDFEKIVDGFKKIGQGISDAFSGLLVSPGKDIIEGLFQGILDAFGNIKDWLKSHISEPLLNGFKSLFGIASPSTVMKELGIYIIQGLIDGIESLVENIFKIWESIKKTSVDIWNNTKDLIIKTTESIKNGTLEKWENIKSSLAQKWSNIKNNAASTFDSIKINISQKWDNIKSKTSSVWLEAKNIISNSMGDIKTKIADGASNSLSVISNKFDSIKQKISSVMESAKSAVSSGIEKIKSKFNFSWSLPKLKLPHFSVSGSFSLKPPSVPHFDVDWYASGGYLPKQYGLIGAGENGVPEVLGSVGGRPAIAGGVEITGISDTIRDTSEQQMRLMTEEISILRTIVSAIYEKETGQSASGLFNSVRNEARSYYKRTGKNGLVF